MAALMSLTQISNGNPVYETLYRQLDPGNLGKVGATEAAQFLKRSGLSDSTLVKIWDLSDLDRKGYLDKRGFFIALRLVASAQSGGDVSQAVLSQTKLLPAPKFRDTGSPSLIPTSSSDASWAVKFDEKVKYDSIFETLSPVNGLLSGDKVKPVLINSNLPLDVLGKIWDLSDIDKDGHLDKEEFAVAMHLVYRAREKEPVPSILPASMIPPSKRKKSAVALAGSVPVLPSSPFLLKENLRSTVPLSKSPLTISSNLSPSNSFRSFSPTPSVSPTPSPIPAPQLPVSTNWVVPQEDKEQYEEIFDLADSDFDGMVGGGEVKDIFINSGLPQKVLAQIWSLADTQSVGKLTKEQFCLAMHLIQQTVSGVDPPQSLNADMIPPSERSSAASTALSSEISSSATFDLAGLSGLSREISSPVVQVELTGNKELDDINQEIAQLQSEKHSMEQEIRQKEEALRQKNSELHRMQVDLEQENSSTKELEQQTQSAQNRLQEMEQQRSKLESKVTEARSKVQEESNKISSLQTQIISKEANQQMQEKELSKVKTDLYCLEQEEKQLEENLRAGKAKLQSILKLLKTSQNEMDEVREEISQTQEKQKELNKTIERFDRVLKGSTVSLAEIDKILAEEGSGVSSTVGDSSFKARLAMFNNSAPSNSAPSNLTPSNLAMDPFQTEDPFKSDPFNKDDPFGGDPFKQSDPFRDPFGSSDRFTKSPTSQLNASPFGRQGNLSSIASKLKDSDPFAPSDAFDSFGGNAGFADFGSMSKGSSGKPATRKPTYPLPPPKKPTPGRPAPPPYGTSSAGTRTGVAHRQTLGAPCFPRTYGDSLSLSQPSRSALTDSLGLADLKALGNEVDQLEWAKRESKREEERLRRLRIQEQQDLELALALSRVDMSRT